MLDKTIVSHLDEMDAIVDDVYTDIDMLMELIDIDKVIDDPHGEMALVAEDVKAFIEDKYAQQSITKGVEFAKEITKKEHIKVPVSDNPELNKDLL